MEIFTFKTSAFDFPLPGKHSTKQAKRLAKDLRQGVERAKSSMDVDYGAGNREGEYHVCLVIPTVHIRMCKRKAVVCNKLTIASTYSHVGREGRANSAVHSALHSAQMVLINQKSCLPLHTDTIPRKGLQIVT